MNFEQLKVLLEAEAFEECDPDTLKEECVDVANFCMMIFDKLEGRNA